MATMHPKMVRISAAIVIVLQAVTAVAFGIGKRDDEVYDNDGFVPNLGPKLSTLEKGKLDILWNFNPRKDNVPEEFMSTPILHTSSSRLLFGSSTNTIYSLSTSNGLLLASRQLRPTSFPCGDMKLGVGILGTPAIDEKTRTGYVYAKGPDGYYLHAFSIDTLKERKGFPIRIDGPATNSPDQYLNSTNLLQRPQLTIIDGNIYAAFGGGCGDHLLIVSGWVVAVSASSRRVLSRWSTLGSSIWHAGAGMSSDRPDRLFFATANGDATSPYEGAVLKMSLSKKTGSREVKDSFRPWNYTAMDESQRDIGASTVALTSFVLRGKKTVVAGGKNGIVHVLDRERLGGYGKVEKRNKVLQEWSMPEVNDGVRARLFYGVGSWPRKGLGYLYLRPLDVGTVLVYEFDERSGFKLVVQTEETDTTMLGSGAPFVTADGNKDGVLWVIDLKKGLLAWDGTPKNGKLRSLAVTKPKGSETWTYKFQRPVFARRRVYVISREGGVIAYGPK